MPETKIIIQHRSVNGIASIIDIQGELTAFAEKLLMDTYTTVSTPTTRAILLNFSGLEYMNSSGIGLIVTLLIRVNRQKQRLLAYGLSDHYQHIFRLTRLTDAIQIYASEPEAIMALRTLPNAAEVKPRFQGRK
ncbi:MAG TPA: STAS domain-containing protein [Ktedonobacteraceae bacterium]